jgi:hypothetical protein
MTQLLQHDEPSDDAVAAWFLSLDDDQRDLAQELLALFERMTNDEFDRAERLVETFSQLADGEVQS